MILIAHRGNINGPNPKQENNPSYIDEALNAKFDVEIDIWYDKGWWLGHDEPKYKTSNDYIISEGSRLWIHCKNLEALYRLSNDKFGERYSFCNYFWHENDRFTLTSHGYIWTYPKQLLSRRSVCVLPELGYEGNFKKCYGICSDYIEKYKKYENHH